MPDGFDFGGVNRGAPTAPMTPTMHDTMQRARCSLGLTLLARCVFHKRRLSVANNPSLLGEIEGSEGAMLDAVEMAAVNLRTAFDALEAGSPRLAERLILSAGAHADAAIAALAPEWHDRIAVPVPAGANTVADHLRELAEVADAIGRNGDAPRELVAPAVRLVRARVGPKRRRPAEGDDGAE